MGSIHFLAILASLAVAGAAAATPVPNPEGYWPMEAQGARCVARMPADGGMTLMMIADGDGLRVAVASQARFNPGKTAELQTDTLSFAFTPAYADRRSTLRLDEVLSRRARAALRLTNAVVVRLDGEVVLSARVEGTGFAGVLEALQACGRGESGWWGAGAELPETAQAETVEPRPNRPTFRDEGVWAVSAKRDVCTAAAKVGDDRSLVILARNGGADILVGVGGVPPRRYHEGVLSAGAFRAEFKPSSDGGDYVQTDTLAVSQSLFRLSRAKSLQVSLDGEEVMNAPLGSSFPDVLAALQDCALGKSGWWGDGAAR